MTRPDTASHLHPRVTSYRSRRSSVSERPASRHGTGSGRSSACRPAAPEGPAELLDTRKWFGRSAPVVLEIGSGTGTSTLAMAKAEPHIDVVAVEVYRRGLAQLLSAIDAGGRHQYPPGPRRRRRRARAHVRPGVADRGPGVLSGPVAQGAPPQAPAAAAGHGRPDRRPAAARRCAARRHGPRRATPSRSPSVGDAEPRLRRVTADDGLPISVARPITKYETKARDAGSAVAELLWEKLPR